MNTKSLTFKNCALAFCTAAILTHVDASHALGITEARGVVGEFFDLISGDVFRLSAAIGLISSLGVAAWQGSFMPIVTVGGSAVAASSILKMITGS